MQRNNNQVSTIKNVWDAQNGSKEEKRQFYQQQIDKYRASGDMELVSYYVTLYANTNSRKEIDELSKVPDVIQIPDDIEIDII